MVLVNSTSLCFPALSWKCLQGEGLWTKRNGRSRKYEQEKAMKLKVVLQTFCKPERLISRGKRYANEAMAGDIPQTCVLKDAVIERERTL